MAGPLFRWPRTTKMISSDDTTALSRQPSDARAVADTTVEPAFGSECCRMRNATAQAQAPIDGDEAGSVASIIRSILAPPPVARSGQQILNPLIECLIFAALRNVVPLTRGAAHC